MTIAVGKELYLIASQLRKKDPDIKMAKVVEIKSDSILLSDGIEYALCKKSPFKFAISLQKFGLTAFASMKDYELYVNWCELCHLINFKGFSEKIPLKIRRSLMKLRKPELEFDEQYKNIRVDVGQALFFVSENEEIGEERYCIVTENCSTFMKTNIGRTLKLVKNENSPMIAVTDERNPIPYQGKFFLSEDGYREYLEWHNFRSQTFGNAKACNLDKMGVKTILKKLETFI